MYCEEDPKPNAGTGLYHQLRQGYTDPDDSVRAYANQLWQNRLRCRLGSVAAEAIGLPCNVGGLHTQIAPKYEDL